MTADDKRARVLLEVATGIVTAVRDDDPRAVQRRLHLLTHEDLRDVAILLAAMVPDDRPTSQLLAWFTTPETT